MNLQIEKERLCKLEKILAIINDAEQRIQVCKWHIKIKNVFTTEDEMNGQIEMHQKAIERLENYYKNLMSKPI